MGEKSRTGSDGKPAQAWDHDPPAKQKLDRVAQGGYPPWAPTDPYGHALVHTVPQTMGSLRETLDDTRVGERETF